MNRQRSYRASRRGLSLVIVMAVLSTSVVLAIAFLHAQTTALRAAENGRVGDLARQAAQTGLAAALDAMQNPAWAGVASPLIAEVGRDGSGYWSYKVTFDRVAGDRTEFGAAAAALRVTIRSKGSWQALGSARAVEREAVATVSLTPRLAGRPSRPGDVAGANDRSPDVAGFSQAQAYALFAADESNSFFARPETRVAGDIWVGRRLSVFDDLAYSTAQRNALLTGLGTDYGGGPNAPSPHPLAGRVTFYQAPESDAIDALNRLNVPFSTSGVRLSAPAVDPTRLRNYRLYAGGFTYQAVNIGSTIQGVSLGPTDANPLGIFYCNGSLDVHDNVVIRGTLVATSDVTFSGREISITPFDWRDGRGGTAVVDRDLWPVLPAVIAGGHVTTGSACRAFVEGAVVATGDFIANTPDFALENTLLNYDGNATAVPQGGGISEVHVTDLLNLLAGLAIDQRHAVQFRESSGDWGRWYPVVTADLLSGRFQVRGTADFPSPVACRFRPRRVSHFDLFGPLIGRRVQFGNPPAWTNVSGSSWDTKYSNWQTKRDGIINLLGLVILGGRPNLTFSQSLAEDGFPFEPTVRLTRPSNVTYACEPPLFRPDPSARTVGGGYRWTVLSWQEVSP